MNDNDDFSVLVGKIPYAIWIGPREESMLIDTDQGKLYFELAGGCCSESWWSDVRGLSTLMGRPVVSVATEDIEVDDSRTRQESDDMTRYTLTTRDGKSEFEWRNSSNGYYSGWMVSRPVPSDLSQFRAVTHDTAW
jgi:hypothetical protein